MREIDVNQVKEKVKELFLESAFTISNDIYSKIKTSKEDEISEVGKVVLTQLLQNYDIATNERIPICQDTGMAIIYITIGQDVHFINGSLNDAINEGVKEAYEEGYLRKSVVDDPLFTRTNTKTNTPCIIYPTITDGEDVELLCIAKGFGSENMSAIKMLAPSAGEEGVKQFIYDTIEYAGPNACPPMIVGVGIGGTFEKAALMAKHAISLPMDYHHEDERYVALEEEVTNYINTLGIGPGGLGGKTTVLKVNIETFPTHIASLPVAINICCHASRHMHGTL